MTTQHTPGPWRRNIKPATKYTSVWSGQNKHVAHVETRGLTPEEVESNINLIAAAPELLDALQECSTLLGGIPAAKNNQRVADAIHNARAAIAKAEGRA